ncbi:MAG: hypothetical protein DYG96_03635 [Chlorobi bacterium CHB2]|nr:hypothetical protein [Chlorobi bacterium CHB2]
MTRPTVADVQGKTFELSEAEQKELHLLLGALPLQHLPIKQRIRTILMSGEGFREHTLSVLFSASELTIQQWKQQWVDTRMGSIRNAIAQAGLSLAELLKPTAPARYCRMGCLYNQLLNLQHKQGGEEGSVALLSERNILDGAKDNPPSSQ